MKVSHFAALVLFLSTPRGGVAAPPVKAASETESELKPFTAQSNYMSLSGYLRFQNYLATSKWERFPVDNQTHLWRSDTTIRVDWGSQGQMGDVYATSDAAISEISKLIKIFPKLKKYGVSWSYDTSIGEGRFTSHYDYFVSYDKASKTLEDMNSGIRYNITDADIFAIDKENKAREVSHFK
jgi:hypothetical protein